MTRTYHVYQDADSWVVKKEGHTPSTHSTKEQAVARALALVKKASAAQMVVHGKDGLITRRVSRGLPKLQRHPLRGTLGRRAIAKAVASVVMSRLRAESPAPHA